MGGAPRLGNQVRHPSASGEALRCRAGGGQEGEHIMLSKLKTFLVSTAAILSVLGIVTFSLFIFEEAIQMTTFGTWPAQSTGDWGLVLEGCDTIDAINRFMKVVNYSVGWVQPLAFFSYRAFSKATDYYVNSLRRKAFAHSPGSFAGRKVEFVFTVKRVEAGDGQVKLTNGRICILSSFVPGTRKVVVSGVVERRGNLLVIKADSIKPVQE